MKETSTHQVFRSRIEYLNQHIEMVDLALCCSTKQIAAKEKSRPSLKLHEALGGSQTEYPRLSVLPAKQKKLFLSHSRNRNYEHALHLLYSHLEEYAYTVASKLPRKLKAYDTDTSFSDKVVEAKVLLDLYLNKGNLEEILANVIVDHIQKCESGRKILELIEKRSKLKIDQAKKSYAIFVLDIRNCIVHDSGIVTTELHGKWQKRLESELGVKKQKSQLKLRKAFIQKAIKAISEYVGEIDMKLIDSTILPQRPLPVPKKMKSL